MNENTDILEPLEGDLEDVATLLAAKGFTPEKTSLGYRYAVNSVEGKPVCWRYFISAKRALLCRGGEPSFQYDMRTVQESILGEVFYETPRPTLHLCIVGSAEEIAELDRRGLAWKWETDRSYALKWVGTLEALAELLTPLFPVHADAAEATPAVLLLREVRDRPAGKVWPDWALTSRSHATVPPEADLLAEDKENHRQLTTRIYERIMGRDFSLEWQPSELRFRRQHLSESLSREESGRGEHTGLALACFLAEVHEEATPSMTLGFYEVLPPLDDIKRIRALDVLAEFVSATGASLEVQAANESIRSLAKLRLQFSADVQVPAAF